jgi:hypothetical protein
MDFIAILEYLGIERDLSAVLDVDSIEAPNPHVNRLWFRKRLWP